MSVSGIVRTADLFRCMPRNTQMRKASTSCTMLTAPLLVGFLVFALTHWPSFEPPLPFKAVMEYCSSLHSFSMLASFYASVTTASGAAAFFGLFISSAGAGSYLLVVAAGVAAPYVFLSTDLVGTLALTPPSEIFITLCCTVVL